jgi:hypothetical protein
MDESGRKPNGGGSPPDEEEMSYKDALREQERLGGVDASIKETIEAMKTGRENVAHRFYRQEGDGRQDESTHPLDILRTGRKRILEKIASQNQEHSDLRADKGPGDVDSIRSLNRQLYEKLEELTNSIPQDPGQRNLVEMEIQSILKAYQNALHKILNPLRFNRQGLVPRGRF